MTTSGATLNRARAAYARRDWPRAVVHFLRGDESLGSGWLSRAQRLVEHAPDSVEHAYLVYVTEVEGPLGGMAPSEPAATARLLEAARRVQQFGRAHGEATLVAVGCWARAGRA